MQNLKLLALKRFIADLAILAPVQFTVLASCGCRWFSLKKVELPQLLQCSGSRGIVGVEKYSKMGVCTHICLLLSALTMKTNYFLQAFILKLAWEKKKPDGKLWFFYAFGLQ